MKGYGTSVAPVHAGIRSDLETLLNNFKEKRSVRWKDFAASFQTLGMGLIFAGRQSTAELVEFEENLLKMAAVYMLCTREGENAGYPVVNNPQDAMVPFDRKQGGPMAFPVPMLVSSNPREETSLVERVFGVYACYAFFYLQPTDYMAQIRMTPSQLREVMEFAENRLRKERHLDVLACLYKLVNDGAFRIVAFENCYDPSSHKRYEAGEEGDEALPEETEEPLTLLRTVVNDVKFKQLQLLHNRYEKAKQTSGLHVSHGKIDLTDFSQKLLRDTLLVTSNPSAAASSSDLTLNGDSSRSTIKKKAYNSGVKTNRNRRYAFEKEDNGGNQEEREEVEVPPAKKKTTKRSNRPTFKTKQAEENAAFIEEMKELGVPVAIRSQKKGRGRRSKTAEEGEGTSVMEGLEGGEVVKSTRKRKSELKAPFEQSSPMRIPLSKAERDADREMAKLMKMTSTK